MKRELIKHQKGCPLFLENKECTCEALSKKKKNRPISGKFRAAEVNFKRDLKIK